MYTEQQAPTTPRASALSLWSRPAFIAGIVLLVAAMVPVAIVPMQGLKLALFAVFALAAFLLSLGSGMWHSARSIVRGASFVLLLPVAYAISYMASTDRSVAFAGFGLEADTILVVSLAAAAFMLSAAFFSSPRASRSLLTALTWTIGIAAVFQAIVLLTGGTLLPNAFADRTVNIVGKWNDFGLLIGLLALFLLVRGSSWRAYAGAAALAVLLVFVNFPTTWYLLILSIALWWAVRFFSGVRAHGFMRWLPLALIAGAIAFVAFGPALNTSFSRVIPVSSLEVRPALSSTMAVANSSHDSILRTLVGTGPNTFGESWFSYKPMDVNNSLFWNLDFLVGFSAAATAFASVGILGVLAWLIPLFLLAGAVWRLKTRGAAHEVTHPQWNDAVALGLGAVYLMLSILMYVPSQSIMVLALALAGAAYGLVRTMSAPVAVRQLPRMVGAGLLAVSVLALLVMTAHTTRFTAAQMQTNRGAQALTAGNVDEAIARARSSNAIVANPNALRLELDANVQKVRMLLETNDQKKVEAELATTMAPAVVAGQAAILKNPKDYRPLVSLAGLYGMLASVGVQQAYENARDIFQGAALRNPTSPAIPLAQARLEAIKGNSEGVASFLAKALQMKPNYTDAILLDVQLKVAGKDLPGAINSAQAAALTAPTAPAIWFQLGLLHYAAQEYQDAALALEQAVTLLPTYANAKYFLGLSYYETGKSAEAITLFEDLSRSNPDNAEVTLILANLKAGKTPFNGASTTPSVPSSAPITE